MSRRMTEVISREAPAELERWRPQGRPVRMVILTWPIVGLLGATVAAAAGLFTDCEKTERPAPREVLTANAGTVRSIAFRPDGQVISSIGLDGSIVMIDCGTGPREPYAPEDRGPIRSVAFDRDSRFLATANAMGPVTLHDLAARESRPLCDLERVTTGAACLAFSADGNALAVGQQDGEISLWNRPSGKNRSKLAGHTNFVAALVYAPGGDLLASSAGDGSTRIWDLATMRELWRMSYQGPTRISLAFSRDARLLFLGDPSSPLVRVWDLTTGIERAALRGPAGVVVAVAASPDGTTLAAADYQGGITMWDLATMKIRPTSLRHAGVHALAFAPDGRSLATGGFDGSIYLWDFPIAIADRDLTRRSPF